MVADIKKLFHDIAKLKVAVAGDIMLDTYWWGHVERISPEAPVPVVTVDKREQRLGGAGNVALNIKSLGGEVFLFAVIGKDDDAEQLKKILKQHNIADTYLLESDERSTTNKIRIISRSQHMMRLDAENTNDLSGNEEALFISSIEKMLEHNKPDVLILQDYNKGVLTQNVITKVLELCKKHGVITAVDPKRKNFFAYKKATIFKPNLKEVKENLNILSVDVTLDALSNIHGRLSNELHHEFSLITLSEKGIFYEGNNHAEILSAHIRNIADVSGAGDTVIAVAAMTYAATKDIKLSAETANIAGGLVCEEVGTAVIDKEKLIHECELLIK